MNHLPSGNWRADGRPAGERRTDRDNDPGLAFMLARQATNRLQFDAHALGAASPRHAELAQSEAQIAIDQIAALRARIAPFQHGTSDAIRFEAQEILAALDGIHEIFARVAEPTDRPSTRTAVDIAAHLLKRRH